MVKLSTPLIFAILFALNGCSVLQKSSLQNIPEGNYVITKKNAIQKDSVETTIVTKFYLYHENDSIFSIPLKNKSSKASSRLIYPLTNDRKKLVLINHSFDFDIFTTPFKFRPPLGDLPPQFNTNFNGSFYFGYRIDRYVLKQKEHYPGVIRESYSKEGIGLGGFVGAGSVFVNPKFMGNTIDYEYDAFAVDYGFAALFGIRNFSTGLSIGFDLLVDRNRQNWVYQNKPWIGIFIGINLN